MTPNGEIYAPKNVYKADYGVEDSRWKCLFVHEITHVWQYQNNILDPRGSGIGEFFRNWLNYNNAYYYTLDDAKDLTDYHMEQQAVIVEEYYRVIKRGESFSSHCKNSESVPKKKELLKRVTGNFFAGLKK
jgi:type VI secretion system secreted protein VgrG